MTRAENKIKGEILEDVVALLHNEPGIVVQKRLKLATRANPKRKREIDVLISSTVANYPVRIALECKNYGEKVGVELIDGFKGKLEAVGIPVQQGIFVTSSEFTEDARDRAAEVGIRLLQLEGLTSDRLSAEIFDASQSVIFMLAELTELDFDGLPSGADPLEIEPFVMKDASGRIVGRIDDLVWAAWRDQEIPLVAGSHSFALKIPDDWQWHLDGKPIMLSATVTVSVRAILATQFGKAQKFTLRNIETSEVERGHVTLLFEVDDRGQASLSPEDAHSEDDLAALIRNLPHVSRIGKERIRLPRIVTRGKHYWPPSLRAAEKFLELKHSLEREGNWSAEAIDRITLDDIEGNDLRSNWDEIAPDHPAAHFPNWPWTSEIS